MLMTEDEARTKWCPHARVACYAEAGDAGVNRSSDRGASISGVGCLASDCSQWRWGEALGVIERGQVALDPASPPPARTADRYHITPRGYCGLAGEPGAGTGHAEQMLKEPRR